MKTSVAGGGLPRLLALAAAGAIMATVPSSSFRNNVAPAAANRIRQRHRHRPRVLEISTAGSALRNAQGADDRDESTSTQRQDEQRRQRRFSSLRSIGVDYGLVRTGVAVTAGGYRPRPLAILSGSNSTELASAIVDRALSERATNIVLGLPLHKNGTDSEQSEITRQFGRCLLREARCRCGRGAEVVLWDERYTSKEAVARISAEAMSRNERIPSASELGGELDADAACIILEDYYKDLGEDAEHLAFDDEALDAECEEVYQHNLEQEERERRGRMEEQERRQNARREMIERARVMEDEGGPAGGFGGKKKKKKKKKR